MFGFMTAVAKRLLTRRLAKRCISRLLGMGAGYQNRTPEASAICYNDFFMFQICNQVDSNAGKVEIRRN